MKEVIVAGGSALRTACGGVAHQKGFRGPRRVRGHGQELHQATTWSSTTATRRSSRHRAAAVGRGLRGRGRGGGRGRGDAGEQSDAAAVRGAASADLCATAAAKGLPQGWEAHPLGPGHYRIVAPGGETYKSLGAAKAAIAAVADGADAAGAGTVDSKSSTPAAAGADDAPKKGKGKAKAGKAAVADAAEPQAMLSKKAEAPVSGAEERGPFTVLVRRSTSPTAAATTSSCRSGACCARPRASVDSRGLRCNAALQARALAPTRPRPTAGRRRRCASAASSRSGPTIVTACRRRRRLGRLELGRGRAPSAPTGRGPTTIGASRRGSLPRARRSGAAPRGASGVRRRGTAAAPLGNWGEHGELASALLWSSGSDVSSDGGAAAARWCR